MRSLILFLALAVLLTSLVLIAKTGENVTLAQAQTVNEDTREEFSDLFIVVFAEDALAGYDGKIPGYPKPPNLRGKARLDVKDRQAQNYVRFLERRQLDHESRIGKALGRELKVERRMQHALNAVVTKMTPAEADAVRKMDGVRLVDAVREELADTDTGPLLIGASQIWTGNYPDVPFPAQGEGIVAGVIDSGINFGSPSFAAVDPFDGFVHTNPLGSGVYLGTCAAGGVDAGRCNDKLIGGYDFVCAAPGNSCNVAGRREEPGFGDTNGHGSHTASTIAGNRRDAFFANGLRHISGVAPRANVIAYDVCYTNTSTGQGLCPTASSAAAVNQAIADGIVDLLNFSIGGGTSPWSDSVSLAFLNATNAGIYVATSAGNSGPGPNTMGHLEPWTASTAASTHGRAGFSYVMEITGPGTVPDPLKTIYVNEGTNGIPHTGPISAPLVVSPDFDVDGDGCSGYPAGTFQGAIAVVRRLGCSFAIKANSATAAGAIAVVISNNVDGGLIPSVPGTSVPAFGITKADGDAIRDWAAANPGTTATIGFPQTPVPNKADVLASFSSRGPAGNFDLVKPDLTAPGVSVLAAVSGTTITGFEDAVALYNGTSMASPHNAGAAALLRQLHPDWTVPEIKSALEMTAEQTVYKEDGISPATPFDMGGGRIRIHKAANAGLVMHETKDNFTAANPASGGNVSQLNIPSMARRDCLGGCSFTRTFRSTLPYAQDWTFKVQGLSGKVSPAKVRFNPGQTKSVTITIDASNVVPDGAFNFGNLKLQPDAKTGNANQPHLSLPIAIAVQPPVLVLDPATVSASTAAGNDTSVNFNVRNAGSYQLEFAVDNTGSAGRQVYAATSQGVSSGFRSGIYTDQAAGQFAGDDFTLPTTTSLTSVYTEGFIVSGQPLLSVVTSITWSVFPDAGGNPSGDPQASPGSAIWRYTAAPTAPGVTINGANIALDLAAAGQSISLPAGKYWLVVHTTSTLANRWAWFASTTGNGSFKTKTNPNPWATSTSFAGLSMQIQGSIECGASWIGAASPSSGVILGGASRNVAIQINSSGLAPGSYSAAACIASNDPVRPKVAELINLMVTP